MSTQPETILINRADAIEAATIPYQLRTDEAAQHLIELDQAITDATETEVGRDMLFVEVSVAVAKNCMHTPAGPWSRTGRYQALGSVQSRGGPHPKSVERSGDTILITDRVSPTAPP